MMTISAADYAALNFLRIEGFLQDVGKLQGPVVAVMCSDGHQIVEKIGHLVSCTEHEHAPCQHIIATNGGALVLAEDSPIAYDHFEGTAVNMAACCLTNVKRGCVVKRPKTLVLKTHFPCAMARASNLSVADVIMYHAKGYARVEGTVLRSLRNGEVPFSVERVVCCVHVNYGTHRHGNQQQRTYTFDPNDSRVQHLSAYIEESVKVRKCA